MADNAKPQELKTRLPRGLEALLQFVARRVRRVVKGSSKSDPWLVSVLAGDAELNAAIAKARATLPIFWASLAAREPSQTGHSVKVLFENEVNDGEYVWMADVRTLGDGRHSGRFANMPVYLAGKRLGDVAEFAEADIADWIFMRNGKIVGGETIRLLLKTLPKVDADALRVRMETP